MPEWVYRLARGGVRLRLGKVGAKRRRKNCHFWRNFGRLAPETTSLGDPEPDASAKVGIQTGGPGAGAHGYTEFFPGRHLVGGFRGSYESVADSEIEC